MFFANEPNDKKAPYETVHIVDKLTVIECYPKRHQTKKNSMTMQGGSKESCEVVLAE